MKLKTILGEVEAKFYHVREIEDRTIAIVRVPGHTEALYGVAYKNPTDQFNKKIGRKLSLARALDHNLPKEQRRVIWEAYRRYTNEI